MGRCRPPGRDINRAPKRRIPRPALPVPEIARGDSMSHIQTDLIRPLPSFVPHGIAAMSDEECLVALAQAVRQQDSERLDEVARLIGRLMVTIE
jgi:hypothetical protein